MIPQINAMTKMMRLMWTYSLMAIICQLGNPVLFMTSWTHANKGCLCVSIGLQRPMGVQIGNLRFKRVPTGVSVDALTMCSFVKIALLWTSWWYPTVHATLCHSGVTEDHMSRGHHLEQRQSLLMWNKYKLFFKPLCLVFVDSNRTMSSSIGAIWSFISDFIFAQIRNHKQHAPNSMQLHHQPGNWCVCTFRSDRVHRFVLTETDNSLASLSATAVGLFTLMGNSWLDITKIFISNLFAVLDGTVEWTTESAVNETVAVTNNGSEVC